jgi:hypothetical protein
MCSRIVGRLMPGTDLDITAAHGVARPDSSITSMICGHCAITMSAIERHDERRIPNRLPAGKAVMTAQKDLQKRQMGLAPFCDAFVIVTVAGDCDAGTLRGSAGQRPVGAYYARARGFLPRRWC